MWAYWPNIPNHHSAILWWTTWHIAIQNKGPTSYNCIGLTCRAYICMVKSLECWPTSLNEGRGTAGGRGVKSYNVTFWVSCNSSQMNKPIPLFRLCFRCRNTRGLLTGSHWEEGSMSVIADYLFGDCPTLCSRIWPGRQLYPRSWEQRDLPEPLRRVRMEEADDLFIHLGIGSTEGTC